MATRPAADSDPVLTELFNKADRAFRRYGRNQIIGMFSAIVVSMAATIAIVRIMAQNDVQSIHEESRRVQDELQSLRSELMSLRQAISSSKCQCGPREVRADATNNLHFLPGGPTFEQLTERVLIHRKEINGDVPGTSGPIGPSER